VKKPSMEANVDVIVKEPRSRPQTAPPARSPAAPVEKGPQAGQEGGQPRAQAARHAEVSQSVDGRLTGSSSPEKVRHHPRHKIILFMCL
jgi:hypothetical protein